MEVSEVQLEFLVQTSQHVVAFFTFVPSFVLILRAVRWSSQPAATSA